MSERDLPIEQQLMRKVLETAFAPLRDLFFSTLRDRVIPWTPVETTLQELGDSNAAVEQIYRQMSIDEILGGYAEQLLPRFENLLLRAGDVGAPAFASSFSIQDFNLEAFQAGAQEAARNFIAQQVTLISQEEKTAIQQVIERGFEEGYPVSTLARSISGIVGLDAQRARGLDNFVQELMADPGDLSPAEVQATIDRERLRRLRERSKVIARTEVQSAASIAQNALWEQAVEDGQLAPDIYVKQVIRIPAAKPCPICGPLNRMTMPIGGEGYLVHTSKGAVTYGPPPFHPNCRCGERLVRLADIEPRHRFRMNLCIRPGALRVGPMSVKFASAA